MDQQRWVLVTGASTGIGADAALALARRGWHVFAGVRRTEDGERLQSLSAGACGGATAGLPSSASGATGVSPMPGGPHPSPLPEGEGTAKGAALPEGKGTAKGTALPEGEGTGVIEPVILDVTNHDHIAAVAEQIGRAIGDTGLAGLVNNAGIVVGGPLEALPIERFRYQIEVNVTGLLAVTQACLPMLRRAGKAGRPGRIVNISSVNGSLSPPYMGAYAASKHAVEAMADAMRIELRRWRIHVALIKPGPVDTPIWDKARADADAMAEQLPEEYRDLYADDIAAMHTSVGTLSARAIPVERVTRLIVHALESRRPQYRYFPTWEARVSHKWFRALSEPVQDFLVKRALGLK